LRLAQNNLDAALLVAPVDGTIATINGSAGQWISGGAAGASSTSSSVSSASSSAGSSSSSAFITLTDVSQPQVVPQVSEADIGKINLGQPVSFTVSAYPNRTFTGVVSTIEPSGQVASNVVTFNVRCTVDPNQERLLPNMTATVTIVTEQDDDVILVPNTAISYAQTQGVQNPAGTPVATSATTAPGAAAQVMVLSHGQSLAAPVRLGSSDGVNTVVISGLQPGDQVVTGTSGGANRAAAAAPSFGPPAGAPPGGPLGGGPPGGQPGGPGGN
jgi:multidrug efflux pump subunit AcrA (membrane-fusion protein)